MIRFLALPLLLAAGAVRAAEPGPPAPPQPIQQIAGEYTLASSSTAPRNGWGYSAGWISVRPLDERHVLILLACTWQREPKAVCSDYLVAQQREGDVYMQDMNTDAMRFYFAPRTRTLTIVSRGFDAHASVRRDVFTATAGALADPALQRRLQRAATHAGSKENTRVFGPYSTWKYQNNRIEFQG